MTAPVTIAPLPPLEVRRTLREIAFAYVEHAFDVTHCELIGRCRFRHIVQARFAFACIIHSYRPLMSSGVIGSWLKRDHSSIIHAIRRADELIASDEEFAQVIARFPAFYAANCGEVT